MEVSGDTTNINKLKESPQIDKVDIRSEVKQKLPIEQSPPQLLQNSTNLPISSLFPRLTPLLLASRNLSLPWSSELLKSADQVDVNDRNFKYEIAQSAGSTNFPANTWVPTNGTVKVYPSAYAGERYVENKFYWAGAARLSAFSTAYAATYEHDFSLNNSSTSSYGPGTYLTLEQNADDTPWVMFWDTNLPRAYLDTQFQDPSYVVAYTIGSAEARSIKPWIMYTNYIRTRNGSALRDNGSLVTQLGSRNPAYCYSTWCSFRTQPDVPIYAPWRLDPVPGTFNWTK